MSSFNRILFVLIIKLKKKLNYINLIQKLRDLNQKGENENEQATEN